MRKPQKKRINPTFIIILALLAVGLVVIGFLAVSKLGSPIKKNVELPFNIYYNYAFTGNGFVYIEGNSFNYYSLSDNKQNYSVMLENTDVKLAGSDSVQVVYTNSAVRLPKNQASLAISGTVKSVKCFYGFVAVHIEESRVDSVEKTDKIKIFSASGEQLDEIILSGRKLLEYGFFRKGRNDQLYSIELDYQASMPITSVSTYSLTTQSKTGIITIQNQLVECMIFTDKSVFAVGTNDIIRYEAEGNYESYRLLSYGYSLHDSSYTKTNTVFLIKNANHEDDVPRTIRIYKTAQGGSPNGQVNLMRVAESAKSVFACGDKVFVLTAGCLNRYSTLGSFDGSYKLSITVDEAQKLSDNSLLLTSGSKLYLLTLKP